MGRLAIDEIAILPKGLIEKRRSLPRRSEAT
jgi:hypothetical protein